MLFPHAKAGPAPIFPGMEMTWWKSDEDDAGATSCKAQQRKNLAALQKSLLSFILTIYLKNRTNPTRAEQAAPAQAARGTHRPCAPRGWRCPSSLEIAGHPSAGEQRETPGTSSCYSRSRGCGAGPMAHAGCWQPREPGRHLKVFASTGSCQQLPGDLGPPRPPSSALCQLPAPPSPSADCNRSQAAPEQESPKYPRQTSAKGADDG